MSMRDIGPDNYILCVYLQLSVCLTANHSVGVQSVHTSSTILILGTLHRASNLPAAVLLDGGVRSGSDSPWRFL